MTTTVIDENRQIYVDCLQKQLDELDLLTSIFCNPGEIHIYDANVISEFNEYVKGEIKDINSELDLSIHFEYSNEKINIRIQLPNLYPAMEDARVTLLTPLLSKDRERHAQTSIANFISDLDKTEGYIYQVVLWIQDEFENFLSIVPTVENVNPEKCEQKTDLERLWIYSHHIKSKIKRREILHQAKQLDLTGFSKPGKPGIICVEGAKENTQEFWRIIRSMQWQKISIKHIESERENLDKINEWRRFPDFREKLMYEGDSENEAEKMNMSLFMKFLEKHKCGYIKNELFGFENKSEP